MICPSCGREVNELFEVQGYTGTYYFCEICFGGEEDGFDEDWIDDEDFIYGY